MKKQKISMLLMELLKIQETFICLLCRWKNIQNYAIKKHRYTLDTTKSSCDNGVTVDWDYSKWKANIYYENYSATDKTRTKCTLFFNKTAKTVKTALGNIEVNSYKPDLTKSACDTSNCESHEKGIFETTDADGTSYYYRGAVENNYLKFAGYFWRVVRINGNGSIRIIYDAPVRIVMENPQQIDNMEQSI